MIRIYEQNEMFVLRDGRGSVTLKVQDNDIEGMRAMLRELDRKGEIRFVTLRSIMETV